MSSVEQHSLQECTELSDGSRTSAAVSFATDSYMIFYVFRISVKFVFTFVCMFVCMFVGLCAYVCFCDVYILYVLPTWRNHTLAR